MNGERLTNELRLAHAESGFFIRDEVDGRFLFLSTTIPKSLRLTEEQCASLLTGSRQPDGRMADDQWKHYKSILERSRESGRPYCVEFVLADECQRARHTGRQGNTR